MKNNFNIKQLVRENIKALMPYRSARDDFDTGILLDANENSFGSPISNSLDLHRYPMPYQQKLRQKIADYRSVKMENVFVGVGSDEAIDLLFRIFCSPITDQVIINPPTYGMYKVSANINDVNVVQVLLTEDFQLQPDKILNRITDFTKLIFVCSPNNPTANDIRKEDILTLLENFSGLVVVDEAYIDFSNEESWAKEIQNYPNLVVLQTMSKAFGLAGIRLGVALANPEVINYMMKVKAPYNVNKLTSDIALQAFDAHDKISSNIKSIINERTRVEKELQAMPNIQKVYPSSGNFLLFKVEDALNVYKKLADAGIIIRYRGNEPHCENCLRLTIGTATENNQFLEELTTILA